MPNLANRQEKNTKVIYERTNARKKEEDTKMQTFFRNLQVILRNN